MLVAPFPSSPLIWYFPIFCIMVVGVPWVDREATGEFTIIQ
jgi:hypothetical protein